jgi:hypothetical protein
LKNIKDSGLGFRKKYKNQIRRHRRRHKSFVNSLIAKLITAGGMALSEHLGSI